MITDHSTPNSCYVLELEMMAPLEGGSRLFCSWAPRMGTSSSSSGEEENPEASLLVMWWRMWCSTPLLASGTTRKTHRNAAGGCQEEMGRVYNNMKR